MENQTSPKFFGRRKGRVIRKAKSFLLDTLLPRLAVNRETCFETDKIFGTPVNKVRLEIGFGDGTHLAGQALKNPQVGFIGVEVFQNGVANLLSLITGLTDGSDLTRAPELLPDRVDNIRIFSDDVRLLWSAIPDGFFDRVDLLFPDPWPKKKHAGRRFINPENLAQLARILKQGGILRIATDHPVYKVWTLRTMATQNNFEWTARTSNDWRYPPADWVETKYQKKAICEGRRPVFFEYKRL